MKYLITYFALAIAVFASSNQTNLIVGTWVEKPDLKRPTIKEGETTFKGDYTFSGFVVIKTNKGEMRFEVEGTWEVKDGQLKETITKSNQPDIVKIGSITVDTIVLIDSSNLTLRNDKGKEHTKIRKN